MNNFEEFYQFMSDYTEFFEEAASVEEEKMKALLSNDIKRIEHFLNEYQTIIKKIEQYEKKRNELHIKLGLKEKTFKDVVEMNSDREKEQLSMLYNKFRIAVHNVQHYNSKSLEIAKINLQSSKAIGSYMNETGRYDTKGESNDSYIKNANFLDKKV